jgi:hypothetical protein
MKFHLLIFPATGAISIWVLGLGLSCLLGFIVGIAVRPYIIPRVSVFCIFLIFIQQTIAYTFYN